MNGNGQKRDITPIGQFSLGRDLSESRSFWIGCLQSPSAITRIKSHWKSNLSNTYFTFTLSWIIHTQQCTIECIRPNLRKCPDLRRFVLITRSSDTHGSEPNRMDWRHDAMSRRLWKAYTQRVIHSEAPRWLSFASVTLYRNTNMTCSLLKNKLPAFL